MGQFRLMWTGLETHPTLRAAAFLVLALLFSSPALAQLPATRLASVFPPGIKAGDSVEVVIAGTDLDDVEQLLFSHPGLTAKVKLVEPGPFDKGPQSVPNAFVVSAAANVPPGTHEVRAAGRYGISNPRLFDVSELAQTVETEPNNDRDKATELKWPAVMSGRSNVAGDADYYKFSAKPGERLMMSCLARHLDSRMTPLMVVYDALGRELQNSRDSLRGDALVDFTAPAPGDYYLKVHDALYNGGDDYFYRLRVGILPHLDFVFPPVGAAGSAGPFTVFGRNLPGGQPAGLSIDGKPLEKLSVSIPLPAGAALDELSFSSSLDPDAVGLDGKEFRVSSPQGQSNPLFIGVAGGPVTLEVKPNNTPDKAQVVTLPAELAGQFYPQRDQDWFAFEAKLGDDICLELVSQRLGLPTDPSLVVQRIVKGAAGQPDTVAVLAAVDDGPAVSGAPEFNTRTLDPVYRFTVPADGTYRVLVRDSYSDVTADPRSTYRLSIRKSAGDFRLAAASGNANGGSLLLRKGGCAEIRVVAYRREGFDGEIQVTASGLPAGVTAAPVVIGPGNDSTTLVLTAADNAAPALAFVQVQGEAKVGAAVLKHAARFGTPVWPFTPRQPNTFQLAGPARLARTLAVSVSPDEIAPLALQAGADKVWEGSRAAVLKIPYSVLRRGDFKGPVICLPTHLPPGVTSPLFTINPDQAAGELQVTLALTAPVGTHTFYLSALAQPVTYVRNPDAAKRAADRKVEIDKSVTDATTKSQAAAAAKVVSDKLAVDTTAAATAAATAKTAADKVSVDVAALAKTAAESAVKAKAASTAAAGDANLAAAAVAAQKAADEAAVKAKAAADAATVAQKALDDALAKAKVAADDKVVKDKAADEAAKFLALATVAKVEADKRAVDTANIAKPAPLSNVYVPSSPITIKITPAPITLALGTPAIAVKQGGMIELPATITRLYAYNEAVTLSPILPPGVGGLTIANVAIPAGQTQGKLVIAAAANATEGNHSVIVRATLALNGQTLTVDQPVMLKVEKVEAK